MAKGSEELKRRLKLLGVVLALAACVFLIPARFTTPARVVFTEAVGPLQELAYGGVGDVLATTGTLGDFLRAGDRRRAERARIQALQNELGRTREALKAFQAHLESLRGLEIKGFPFKALSAPVTGYDASGLRKSVTIRAGSSDGVRRGMLVCASNAVAGVVVEAGLWRSRVRLLTDSDSCVPARLGRSRCICLIQGTGGETLRLDWVKRDEDVRKGDVVVTASLKLAAEGERLVPAGLPAATVTDVKPQVRNPLFMDVTATARVNLARLESVAVIIPAAPGE